jgi:ATP-binding cassette subfamily A (ABC1) protein 3
LFFLGSDLLVFLRCLFVLSLPLFSFLLLLGAGKTTLLKMVSGLEQPSSGFALINGFDVVQNTSQAQRSMGLCPQFDTLIERLTVREIKVFQMTKSFPFVNHL